MSSTGVIGCFPFDDTTEYNAALVTLVPCISARCAVEADTSVNSALCDVS